MAHPRIIEATYPVKDINPNLARSTSDQGSIAAYLSDEARFPGGHSQKMVEFLARAGASEVSSAVRLCAENSQSMVAIGTQTSLTGASVPMGDTIYNLGRMKKLEVERSENGGLITVQPGVTLSQMQSELRGTRLFLPSAPTYPEATVIGGIATNAAGAKSYKYGPTRNFVEALKVVLPTGEPLEIERGQYRAHEGDEVSPGGYFSLQTEAGGQRRIPVPTYSLPDVPKVSAGYYAAPGMDLVDLFIGSEGTLGVVTEAKLRVIDEPDTYMALINCQDDDQAFELIANLNQSQSDQTIGAVEYLGSKVVQLIKSTKVRLPENPGALLIVQVEGDMDAVESMAGKCSDVGIDGDSILLAEPGDSRTKADILDIREAAPLTVNERIAELKRVEPSVTKTGSDPCVKPADLPRMVEIYNKLFADSGLENYVWGHGEGNLHYNAVPKTPAELKRAQEVVLTAGKIVIEEFGGTGTAEHGVGKNRIKQALLAIQYSEAGLREMGAVKQALDPQGIMAPGNILTP